MRRFRIPALFCALAVLVCALVAWPFAEMGLCDEGTYILMVRTLASTGHIVYNGWPTVMLGWQMFPAAAFVKLFGFSFSIVRITTLIASLALAYLLQRLLVRCAISERNATIGTLALVLSPLYLMISVTFMTDITGLFGVAACFYGCLRAIQTSKSNAAIGWLAFAVVINALSGSARQIAWLGLLVMVPSALWLLRANRRVLVAGAAFTLASVVFILACMTWHSHQPYNIPEHLLPPNYPVARILSEFFYSFTDIPFLMLPLVALFLPRILKCRPAVIATIATLLLCFFFLAIYPSHLRGYFSPSLEPIERDHFGLNVHGVFDFLFLQGQPPLFLHKPMQILLTFFCFSGTLGLAIYLIYDLKTPLTPQPSPASSWSTLGFLLVPFSITYTLILIPRAAGSGIYERYPLVLVLVALPCLVRFYQERVHAKLPTACIVLIGIMAVCSIAVTHNTFALYRARIALAAELRAHGVQDTSVDNGWDYNYTIELQHADHINESRIETPAGAYHPRASLPVGSCSMFFADKTPHIQPLYSISFDPNACSGPAPFAPVHYSRWLASPTGTLYVVHTVPPALQH